MKDQLDSATHKALEKIFEKWNKEKLLDCFPSIKKKCPDALERAHDQIKDYIIGNVMKDYDALNAEKNLPILLEQLKDLLKSSEYTPEDTAKFNPATEPNPPQKSAQEIKRAALAPLKKQKLQDLREAYEKEMHSLNSINQELAEVMKEYSQLQAQVDEITRLGVDECKSILNQLPIEEFSASISSNIR